MLRVTERAALWVDVLTILWVGCVGGAAGWIARDQAFTRSTKPAKGCANIQVKDISDSEAAALLASIDHSKNAHALMAEATTHFGTVMSETKMDSPC